MPMRWRGIRWNQWKGHQCLHLQVPHIFHQRVQFKSISCHINLTCSTVLGTCGTTDVSSSSWRLLAWVMNNYFSGPRNCLKTVTYSLSIQDHECLWHLLHPRDSQIFWSTNCLSIKLCHNESIDETLSADAHKGRITSQHCPKPPCVPRIIFG